jgi:uncharacterized protein
MGLFFAAFLFGLFGNFHCLGMCGPLVLSLQNNQGQSQGRIIKPILYQGGRMLSYVLLGLVMGFLGEGFFKGGLLQALSITLGLVLLLQAIHSIFPLPIFLKNNIGFSLYSRLQSKVLPRLKKGSMGSNFILGMLNGLLPCGLVYLGLAGAMASGSWFYGLVFMSGFGLGTVPVMLFLSLGWMNLSDKIRGSLLRIIPGLQFAMAVLLILRGLNLGVPYVSPQWPSLYKAEATQVCHVP